MKARLLILILACGASSCGSVAEAYVAADQATYQAVAPEYRRYVEADPALDQAAKARRLRTLDTWAARLASAQGSSPSSSPATSRSGASSSSSAPRAARGDR